MGGAFQFVARVEVSYGVPQAVKWVSTDSSVATVDQTGQVTAVKPGSASIRAISVADPTVSGTSSVLVLGSRE